jgi:drug/metabolite transporter (DMT)-like permease
MAFAGLGLIWGSSFLWIKIAVSEINPLVLVGLRLLFGVTGLLIILILNRQALPRDRQILRSFVILAVLQTALPFVLISWGETRIDSAMAAILDATVPLFTIIIAHFWLHDEKITLPRAAGLVVGFVGVIVLVSRDLGAGVFSGEVAGQLAVLAGSVSYGFAITFARKYVHDQTPIVQATTMLVIAASLIWLVVPVVERPIQLPVLPITWLALAWLGLLGSCTAYLLYFYLINRLGATRTSLVTYIFPVVGLMLGIVFLRETADWHLAAGSLLVVAGIAVVNRRPATGVVVEAMAEGQ